MDLALKDVRHHLGKFAATIIGVGLLQGIVLTMNGIYRGNIMDGIWLIDHTQTDLWVVERGRGGPFNEQSRIPDQTYRAVSAAPGVEQASPFISYVVEREVAGKSRQFTIIGYDVFGGLGGPESIVEGRGIERAHYEMVADAKLGLKPGDKVRLELHDYEVVGVVRGAVDSGGNPLIYVSWPDAQEILYQRDNEALRTERAAALRQLEALGYAPTEAARILPLVTGASVGTISAVLVRLSPGMNPHAVASHIRSGLFVNVYTTGEEKDLMLKGRLIRMTQILGLFRALLIVVSVVVIALLLYVLTMEKIKSIATLKLIVAQNSLIVRLIFEQSLVITVASFFLGYALISATHEKFPRTLVFVTSDTVLTFIVILVGGALASLLGIVHALRTPPSLALGG